MGMYQSQVEWVNFCEKMNQLFDIENTNLPFTELIITQRNHPAPWNKGKLLGKEWADARKQHKHTPEQYQKVISHLEKIRKSMYTEERSQKISKSLTGVPLTTERKKNISIAKTGTKHSEETKNKIAASLQGKKRGSYKKRHFT